MNVTLAHVLVFGWFALMGIAVVVIIVEAVINAL